MKQFKNSVFSVIVAVVLAIVTLGGVGTVSAAEVLDDKYTGEISYVDVYSDSTDCSAGSEHLYTQVIKARTLNNSITSFQMRIIAPEFVTVERVTVSDYLKNLVNSTFTADVNEREFTAAFSAANSVSGDVELMAVTFQVSGIENASGAFSFDGNYQNMFVGASGETLGVSGKFGVISTATKSTVKKGDFDQNGTVDLSDVIAIQRYIVSGGEISEVVFDAGDINRDGTINVLDCHYIQKYLVGEISSLDNVNGGSTENPDAKEGRVSLTIIDDSTKKEIASTVYRLPMGESYAKCFSLLKENGISAEQCIKVESKVHGWNDYASATKWTVSQECDVVRVYVTTQNNEAYVTLGVEYYVTDAGGNYVQFAGSFGRRINLGSSIYDAVKEELMGTMDEKYIEFGSIYTEFNGEFLSENLVSTERVVTEDDVKKGNLNLYVLCKNISVSGNFDLGVRTAEGKFETRGNVIISENSVSLIYNGIPYNAIEFICVAGQCSLIVGDYTQMSFYMQEVYNEDGAVVTVGIVDYFFDGSNRQPADKYKKYAGSYKLNVPVNETSSLEYGMILYDNGVFKMTYQNLTQLGYWEVSAEDGVIVKLYQNEPLDDKNAIKIRYLPEIGSFEAVMEDSGTDENNPQPDVPSIEINFDKKAVLGVWTWTENVNGEAVKNSLTLAEDHFELALNGSQLAGIEYYVMNQGGTSLISVFESAYKVYNFMLENNEITLVSTVDANEIEGCEYRAEWAGTYTERIEGISFEYRYEFNADGLVTAYVGEFKSIEVWTVDANGMVTFVTSNSKVLLNKETGTLQNGGSGQQPENPIGESVYAYTDEKNGVSYTIKIGNEFFTVDVKGADFGESVQGEEIYRMSMDNVEWWLLYVDEFRFYQVSITKDGKVTGVESVDYSRREHIAECAALASDYNVVIDGVKYSVVLYSNGVVAASDGEIKQTSLWTVIDLHAKTINIQGMTFVADVESQKLILVEQAEVVEK